MCGVGGTRLLCSSFSATAFSHRIALLEDCQPGSLVHTCWLWQPMIPPLQWVNYQIVTIFKWFTPWEKQQNPADYDKLVQSVRIQKNWHLMWAVAFSTMLLNNGIICRLRNVLWHTQPGSLANILRHLLSETRRLTVAPLPCCTKHRHLAVLGAKSPMWCSSLRNHWYWTKEIWQLFNYTAVDRASWLTKFKWLWEGSKDRKPLQGQLHHLKQALWVPKF